MTAFTRAMGWVGWLMLCSVAGQAGAHETVGSAAYHLSPAAGKPVFSYMELSGEPALGLPESSMRHYAGIAGLDVMRASRWLDPANGVSHGLVLGYAWRNFRLEGSAFSEPARDRLKLGGRAPPRLDSRSTLLSFHPSPNWAFQISRGTLSGLDQLVLNGEVRRIALSATYTLAFGQDNWQTTLAWGRSSRKFREATVGYLLESTLRFSGTHAVFGRLEQMGSDELLRDNESLQRQMLKINKLTVGYFRQVEISGPLKFDMGVFASKHFIPSTMIPSYGNDPTSCMMFVRLKLQ